MVGGVIVIALLPRFKPPITKFCEVTLLLAAAILGNAVNAVVLSKIEGTAVAVTVLLGMLIVLVEAPELDNDKSPEYGLDATVVEESILTYIGVEFIVPDAPIVIGEVLVPIVVVKSEEVATSNPTGGVTSIPAFISAPEIVMDWATDGLPTVVVNANKLPDVEMTGTFNSPMAKSPKVVTPVAWDDVAFCVPVVGPFQAELL